MRLSPFQGGSSLLLFVLFISSQLPSRINGDRDAAEKDIYNAKNRLLNVFDREYGNRRRSKRGKKGKRQLRGAPKNKGTSKKNKSGKGKKKKTKKKKEKNGSTNQVCDEFLIQTRSSATYDYLVLEEMVEVEVTWDVSPFSRFTTFSWIIPSVDEEDARATAEEISDSDTVASSEVDQVPVGYGSTLKLLGLSEITNGCTSNNIGLHVTVPRTVKEICFGSSCRQVLCPLSHNFDPFDLSTGVSYVQGNNEILFGSGIDCKLVKPEFWDNFILTHFGNTGRPSEDYYFEDPDGDGLTNIVEYYGLSLSSIFVSGGTVPPGEKTQALQGSFPSTSTDPTKPDTDGDLLMDGFEWMYGLDPLTSNNIMLDSDGDGLSDFTEQIFGTNPLAPDSDFDDLIDSAEINSGSDPLDDTSKDTDVETVNVALTVGDHSGSHSERYTMLIGSVEHQATEFGVLATATYPFTRGVHNVQVNHRDSNLATLDYDYTARIVPQSSETLKVTISDPQGLLGTHSESSFDFAAGKTATMTVESKEPEDCSSPSEVDCSCFSTCTVCNSQSECTWSQTFRHCRSYFGFLKKDQPRDCACQKCEDWASVELNDRGWIAGLPQCPCTATFESFSVEVNNSANVDADIWDTDLACAPNRPGLCFYFHPGATGCIRAPGPNLTGQQCCYNDTGNVLPHGHRGAGTPDRIRGGSGHNAQDVEPFKNCCIRCEDDTNFCSKYIGDSSGNVGARSDNRGCVN